MTAKPKRKPKPEIQNPRYAGATPDMVARAVMLRKPKGGDGKTKASRIVTARPVRSSI